jgi:16S rRNA (cytosine1402-N4)-methyltransferase
MYHNPVLLKESIEGLAVNPKGIYVDVTFGGGGHSRQILKRLTSGKLIAFDQDEDSLKNKIEDERFTLVNSNFRYLKNFLQLYDSIPVDGILADLGVSSYQIDNAERGFSTRYNGILDLRMDKRNKLNGTKIINNYSEDELNKIFYQFGEIKNASKLTSIIVEKRKKSEIKTIYQFIEAINTCVPKGKENKYLAKVFQAIRIEVNNELDALKEFLKQSTQVLKSGGRLVVISYHSLEDRLVKNFMKSGNFEGEILKDFYGNPLVEFKLITKKPIIAAVSEIEKNSRARSAKLRIAEKI